MNLQDKPRNIIGCNEVNCHHKYSVTIAKELKKLSEIVGQKVYVIDEYHFSFVSFALTFMDEIKKLPGEREMELREI